MKKIRDTRTLFTLVEMLVVISILMILAALLLPCLQSAVKSSRGISCLSNQKGIGQALQMYADDWGGYMINGKKTGYWDWLSYKYIGKYLGYNQAPSNWSFKEHPATVCPEIRDILPVMIAGYVMNSEVVGDKSVASYYKGPFKLQQVIKPSEVIIAACGNGSESQLDRYRARSGMFGWENHGVNIGNLLYCDGHAQAMTFTPDFSSSNFLNAFALSHAILTFN